MVKKGDPSPKKVKRIAARYYITRLDDEYWAKAFDQGGKRFNEADYIHGNRERVCRVARKRVNSSYSPGKKENEDV